jgi:hypothetical protein
MNGRRFFNTSTKHPGQPEILVINAWNEWIEDK